jgi:hypothetical protein
LFLRSTPTLVRAAAECAVAGLREVPGGLADRVTYVAFVRRAVQLEGEELL